jgi:RimJ/RimL family protein N-acetyltransferase
VNNFIFKKSITESQIDELINYSITDPQIIKYTADQTRFGTRSAYNDWLDRKHPIIYTLSNKEANLCGLIWFEKDDSIEGCEYTFAIRLYADARGKGLSFDFMKQSFDDLKPQSVWLKCSADNIPANLTYQKFGFKQITEPDENNKITFVLKNLPSQS